jgi:Synergist-CTERM protein sorting domain-containing protein
MGGDTDMAGGGGDMGGGPKITMCPAAGAAPLASGTCEVTAGDGNKLITADVLLPGEVLRGGQVLVDESGRIACAACDCASATGAAGATRINCPTGVISPSFINTHDHIPYQTAPKPDSGERYEHRNDWRGPKRGHTGISSGGSTNTDGIRFAELRALMAGTTAVIGESNQSTPQGLLRNLDQNGANEGLGKPAVESDTFPLEAISSNSQIASGCAYPEQPDPTEIDNLDAYVIHVAEGIDAVSRNEFLCLSGNGTGSVDVVKDQTSMVHLIGLDAADYALLASKSTALVWSPRSNIRLYGNTAQVALADRVGVLITLGTDWVPSGSMNMLRELRCADELNSTYFDNHFSDEDLWKMATLNAAVALDMGDVIGSIKPGLFADLAIFDAATRRDHRAVIAAEPSDVVLVMRAGKILYGDAAVVTGARQGCETLDVCGRQKAACVMDETGKSLSAIQTAGANLYPLFFCPGQTIPNEPTCVPKRPAAVMGSTVYTGEVTSTDSDGDGIPDSDDNCPKTFNPIRPLDGGKQPDADSDGVGDACDPCPTAEAPDDADGDGVCDLVDAGGGGGGGGATQGCGGCDTGSAGPGWLLLALPLALRRRR